MTGLALPAVGAPARLRRGVERYSHFQIEAEASGIVTEASESLVALRMNEPVPGAEHWDNELWWTAEDGVPILGALAGGVQLVAAAFHMDAEVTGVPRAQWKSR